MLFRLRRMELLVFELLKEGRLVEALRTLRAIFASAHSIKGITVSAIQAIVDATNLRLADLSRPFSRVKPDFSCPRSVFPSAAASHRAAVCYFLHEWLRSLSPDLFPSFPQSESSYREQIRAAGGEEEEGNIGDEENVVSRHHEQFTETIPVFPFEADYFSSPSVAATLAQQIYGYSGVGHREKK
ncbi:hypothetical protein NGA_0721400 [Nannochloropsis gaditana CCMP526]|uniref:uncharacterized protein n=1 Tax=Nannochloropsis gaditana (strain CCMP526) TaxID=1093141 RepID=UPI00029F5A6F|nr:hypothetical protein NGA_0721400 [Nannochloropsis gaditana CCMP526]EKU23256.1 hypothetical protein NGA_0721400 [Nannochloropsis gaditana CCMP526]|eukprot:XP_005852577.1 hypothetical protein NGA_0721400 [Nannochloropsis gaditana CCMP526]